ncbi:MAG TPA: hypothetical protein VGR45_11965 [Stellaceae bacterium]|nr:hypothetical protein [Stellaceae bacterium]
MATLTAGQSEVSNLATASAVLGAHLDTATVNGTATTPAGSTLTLTDSDIAEYNAAPNPAVPGINIEKLVSADGGKDWWLLPDDPGAISGGTESSAELGYISAALGSGFTGQLFTSSPSSVLAGTTLDYAVVVTNTTTGGSGTMTGITVTDSPSSLVFTVGGTLTAGQSELSSTATAAAVVGTHTDTASVSGIDSSSGSTLSDADIASYSAVAAGINIEKLVSADGGKNWYLLGDDAGGSETAGDFSLVTAAPGFSGTLHNGSPAGVLSGATLSYEVVVTNTSPSGLSDTGITVSDNTGLVFTLGSSSLAANSSELSSIATTLAVSGGLTDTVTVSATASDSFGNTVGVGDSDKASYSAVAAGINIEKLVSADGGKNWYLLGDDAGGSETAGDFSLVTAAPGFSGSLHQGTLSNVLSGAKLSYEVVVTNTSPSALSDTGITVTDSAGLVFTLASTSLAANSSELSSLATATASVPGLTNTVTVKATASDSFGHTVGVSDSDKAVYTAATPSINIEKLVSVNGGSTWFLIDDHDHGTQDDIAFLESITVSGAHPFTSANLSAGTPTVASGSTLSYEVVVTNTSTFNESGISVTDSTGLLFAVGSSLTAGKSEISTQATTGAVAGTNPDTVTVTGTASDNYGNTASVTDSDVAAYMTLFPQMPGLTAGFWAQHTEAWDGDTDSPYGKLVSSGVLSSPDVLYALPTHGTVNYGTSPSSNQPPDVMANVGVLLGDANANGVADTGEATLSLPWLAATDLVNASLSNKSDARLNLLQQAVAAQLNIDNLDPDPGLLSAGSGGDLMGTVVQWLKSSLPFSSTKAPPPASLKYNVDNNNPMGVAGVLDSGTTSSFEFNTSKGVLDFGGSVDAISTSSTDWSPVQAGNFSKDGYFVVVDQALTGKVLSNEDVVATGQDLKNALQAFNMDQLVTNLSGGSVGWNNNGVISDVQTNDAAGMWKVLTDHGIGLLAPTIKV